MLECLIDLLLLFEDLAMDWLVNQRFDGNGSRNLGF